MDQRAHRLQAPLSLRRPTARCVRQVTTGRWDVRALYGVDEASGCVYFSAPERERHRHRHLPHQARRHRPRRGCRSRPARTAPSFNPALHACMSTSGATSTTPTQVRLHRADGAEVRVHRRQPGDDARASTGCRSRSSSRSRRATASSMDGDADQAARLRSGAPLSGLPVHLRRPDGAPQVRNSWGGTEYMFHQLLAQQRRRRLAARQPQRQRQGRRVAVAGLRPARRDGAAGSRGRRHLAEAAAVRRRVTHRARAAGATAAS